MTCVQIKNKNRFFVCRRQFITGLEIIAIVVVVSYRFQPKNEQGNLLHDFVVVVIVVHDGGGYKRKYTDRQDNKYKI